MPFFSYKAIALGLFIVLLGGGEGGEKGKETVFFYVVNQLFFSYHITSEEFSQSKIQVMKKQLALL